MKKYAYLLLLFITMHACKKDCIEKADEFIPVKPEMRNSIPYQDGQVVNFNRSGEIYSFVVNVKLDTATYATYICRECCTDTLFEKQESFLVELYDSIHYVRFTLNTNGGDQNKMYLNVNPFTNDYVIGSDVYYSLKSDGSFNCDFNPLYSGYGTVCHETITLGSTLYHNVAEINHESVWRYDVQKVYYSQEKGILRVLFWASNEWELVLVE